MTLLLIAGFFSAAIAVSGSPARVSAQEHTTLAEAVPAGSVMFVEVELDQSSDQWTQVYDLFDRAGISDLAQQELDASPEQVGEMAETFEFTGHAALVFTSPEAFTAESMNEMTGEAADLTMDPMGVANSEVPEGFAVVFEPDNPDALYEQFQSMVADEADQAGTTIETTDYNGVTIEYWESTDGVTDPTAIAMVEDTLVLAVRPDDVEPIIDSVTGEVDTLASEETFSAVRGAFGEESLVFGYLDTTEVLDQSMIEEEPELSELLQEQQVYLGWNMWADDAGFRMDTVTLPADGATSADVTTFDPTIAERVSADSLVFLNGMDIAGSGVTELIGTLLQTSFAESVDETALDTTPVPVATPTTDEVFEQLEGLLGFNLKTDLLDQLDGEFGVAVNVEQVFSDAPVVDVIFVADAADDVVVEDVTSKITYILTSAVEDEVTISERQVTGGVITSMVIEDGIAPGTDIIVEYGVVGGQLIIGVNDGVDTYVDGAGTFLADDPIYQQTMDALPQENLVSVQFLNLTLLLPMIEEAALSLEASTMMLDADEACGDYATQEEAQAAYDADDVELWNLDMDYDGEACEDYFTTETMVEASPASVTEDLNILSVGSVTYVDENDLYRTDSILLIGE